MLLEISSELDSIKAMLEKSEFHSKIQVLKQDFAFNIEICIKFKFDVVPDKKVPNEGSRGDLNQSCQSLGQIVEQVSHYQIVNQYYFAIMMIIIHEHHSRN